jgi:ribosome-interacting GTPase 1
MPTNLPPEAQEAERLYRAARTPEEKISTLEGYISLIPKHKGTDHLRADLRRKLSKLKESASQRRKSVGRQESPYHIDPEGAGQVVVVGCTNVGKSALVATLTNATPEVSASPFSTWEPTPGMMFMENVPIQLIDTPPLNPDYVEPLMLDLIRRCDLVLLVVDLQAAPIEQLETSAAFLEEHGIVPEHWQEWEATDRRVFVKPFLVAVNKHDDEHTEEVFQIFLELLEDEWPLLPLSTRSGRNLEYLKRVVYERLGVIRVYSKAPGQEPDRDSPFILKEGGTVAEFARQIHQDFYEQLRTARVWGTGVYDGQMVSRDHVLHDEDVVELRI